VPGLFQETFGMTILEGMAYGLPVIVPPVGAPVDIVTEGHDGFRIDSRKTHKLKACIEQLATDKPRYQKLATAARQTAKSYDQDRFSKKIVQIFAS
jgi:glycosyltransferase involved in cell wall biosynthesis